MDQEKTPVSAYLAALAQSCIIGFTSLFVKLSQNYTGAFEMLSYRLAVAFLCALVPVLLGKVKVKAAPRDLLAILPLTIVYPLVFFSTQVFALQTLPTTESAIITALAPIVTVVLAAIFLKEHTTRGQVLFILLSMGGVIFLMVMKGASAAAFDVRGTLIMMLNMLSFAVYTVLMRRLAGRFSAYALTFYITLMGFVVFTLLGLGQHLLAGDIAGFFAPLANVRLVITVLYLGAAGLFGTSALAGYALSKIESSRMIVFSNLSVVITIFAGVLILAEPLYWYHIVGAVIIIAGVFGTNWLGSQHKRSRLQG